MRSYAYRVMVETSCVRSIRPAWAAHANTTGSSAPDTAKSWRRTRSNVGWRRHSPRTMFPLKFSSAASKSIAYWPWLARRANNRSRTPCGSNRASFC
jgi:hypothetical protein